MKLTKEIILFVCCAITAVTLSSCAYSKWHYGVHRHGASFERIRFSKSGTIIATLASDTDVLGWPCRKGWVHFNNDWTLQNCTLNRPVNYRGLELPAGTWIELDHAGELRMCSFPDAISIQGYTCIGTGGVNGYHVSFYPGGRLKYFYPTHDVVIGNIPVKGGLFSLVGLHENGELMIGSLSRDAVINGKTIKKGTRVSFSDNGSFADSK